MIEWVLLFFGLISGFWLGSNVGYQVKAVWRECMHVARIGLSARPERARKEKIDGCVEAEAEWVECDCCKKGEVNYGENEKGE